MINFLVIKNINTAKLKIKDNGVMYHDPIVMLIDTTYFYWDFEVDNFIREPDHNGQVDDFLKYYEIVDREEAMDFISIVKAKNLLLGKI